MTKWTRIKFKELKDNFHNVLKQLSAEENIILKIYV